MASARLVESRRSSHSRATTKTGSAKASARVLLGGPRPAQPALQARGLAPPECLDRSRQCNQVTYSSVRKHSEAKVGRLEKAEQELSQSIQRTAKTRAAANHFWFRQKISSFSKFPIRQSIPTGTKRRSSELKARVLQRKRRQGRMYARGFCIPMDELASPRRPMDMWLFTDTRPTKIWSASGTQICKN